MPVPQPDEVLELAQELKEARSRVEHLEAQWNAFFSQATNHASSTVPVLFLKPRIVQYLEDNPKNSYTLAQVSAALAAKENSVGPYLAELAKTGQIEKRGRGLYGALSKEDGDHRLDYERENPQPTSR